MARTSRNPAAASSMDALDNIDLDDMFADEGDALFDGLDIDLGNMDDIAGTGSVNDDSNARIAPLHEEYTPVEESSRVRRPNKRKIKSPLFFDDDDEDYSEVHKKKTTRKKPTKTTGPTKKTKAKAAPPSMLTSTAPVSNIPAPTPLKSKKAKSTSLSMPPPAQRGSVAAAGQFGGRSKKGTPFSYTLPKTASGTNKVKSLTAAPASRASSLGASNKSHPLPDTALAQVTATHPGLQQGSFCGLLPSNTLFYPFMSALPSEASLKHRKLFPIIDRIHTTFLTSVINSNATKAKETKISVSESDPIVALMQECYKEEKVTADGSDVILEQQQQDRALAIAKAAGETRRTVSLFEKHRLAGDLIAVCSLLKRQHDFLKQNMSNMEQWCKSHFIEQDYSSTFLPPKQKGKRKASEISSPGNVLSSFAKNQIKVRILCTKFKEPSNAPLYAMLRSHGKIKEKEATPKSKKTKVAGSSSAASLFKISSSTLAKSMSKTTPAYIEMKPSRRRANIADLIGRVAHDLELKYLHSHVDQIQAIERQQDELQKVVDQDPVQVVHTDSMWRWLEKSGHFMRISDSDIHWRLESHLSKKPRHHQTARCEGIKNQRDAAVEEPCRASDYWHRLQSLLVDAGNDDDSEDKSSSEDTEDLYDEVSGSSEALDLSKLSLHQRTFLHSRSFGLLGCSFQPLDESLGNDKLQEGQDFKYCFNTMQVSNEHEVGVGSDFPQDIDTVVAAMIEDLNHLDLLNSKRALFLKTMMNTYQLSDAEAKSKSMEANLISKCHQLLKKNKLEKNRNESKAKPVIVDEYALPW